ncbi:afadin [Echeneis naucrates]|uniref:afadin n=1 Tax=Echeneis naucrates TaxID=173247 RepID=UPI00111340B7|nr:afadin-like [Echeneis naucrates]
MPEKEDREKLAKVISQWNNKRLDLFEISQPDENLEFHGVMRFYFEDHIEGNVATKCLRVCSNSSTHEILETLSEKFRPDMKMLTTSYSLYEIHAKKERKLDLDERPLIVQLNWNSDNREGYFVLKKDKETFQENCQEKEKGGMIQNFKRTLSRKEKKSEKNKTQAAAEVSGDENRSTEKLLNNSIYGPSHEKNDCTDNKKDQSQAALGVKHSGHIHPESSNQSGLPLGIKLCDNSADALLSAVINYTNTSTVHFKLSPAYALYVVGRFALQRHYRQGSSPSGQTHTVTSITNKMVAMTGKVIQKQQTVAGALAFWIANSSELLHFFKHDKDLCPLTKQSQPALSHLVYKAYSFLLQCLKNELAKHLPTFLIDPEQNGPLPAGIEMVLNTLMNTMSLLRRCRVNPAITIQLFSQLFHFISVWLFNKLMSPEANAPGLRSHYWGAALRQRLSAIEAWAERQGLELAADCHLGHIIQATTLLTMNKYSVENAKDIQNTCFKLNSLQLQTLLKGYLYANNEPHIPPGLIDAVVAAAEASADSLIQSEGRDIRPEESLDLHLPFLLPEGGYSCDTLRGIPPGFREFLEPVCQKGLCSLTSQSNPKGDWTVYFSDSTPSTQSTNLAAHREPEIVTITLSKPLNSSMGISIVAAKGAWQGNLGIYVKSIVRGGPAELNGRLTAGDQLLSVDGQSLVGISQERAAAIMVQTGPVVTLQVAKFGASYHGLDALLGEPALQRSTGEKSGARPNSDELLLHGVAGGCPSEQLHGRSRGKKQQIMQRNRQLYRSNPNMTDFCLEDRDEPVDPVWRGNHITSVSSINLYPDTFRREYLTLPNPKSQDKNICESSREHQTLKVSLKLLDGQISTKRALMRQARSQENLCVDGGGPLLDKRQNQSSKQTYSSYSSFPFRSSVSTHDILSDSSSPTKQQQVTLTSNAGVWRAPFSQHPTPTPPVQPVRIDIPVTRAVNTHSNPPLITFQSSSVQSVKMSQTSKVNGHELNPTCHIYARPVSAAKKLPQQPRPGIFRGQAAKPQVSIIPTKHVSFQDPPTQQGKWTGPVKQSDLQELSGPWRREAQERLERQHRLQAVELLQQEVQELQAKDKRSAVENDRLRRLSLEWQFQKRLQEVQQKGEDEDGEDEELDMMVTIQQLETTSQKPGENQKTDGS